MQGAARNQSNIRSELSFSQGMLSELRDAHRQLQIEIANMDAATCEPQPDAALVATARWRISQAGLQRRRISAKIRDGLLPVSSAEDASALKLLQEADQELQRKSRLHVEAWTTDRDKSTKDWPGYCEASRVMRWHISAYISLEQRILYPMIQRAALRGY